MTEDELRKENDKLRHALRAVLPFLPGKHEADLIYAALGMERPPLRKLTGPVPRYQQRARAGSGDSNVTPESSFPTSPKS